MGKEAIFTLTVEQELRDEFLAAAEAFQQSPSKILADLMQNFVQQQRKERDYQAFLEKKTETARRQIAAGESLSDDEVEQEFARRRYAAAAKSG